MDGYVLYLDRQFEIIEGSFSNPDPFSLNPNLNVEASTDVFAFSPHKSSSDPYTITMYLSGTLEQPILRFSSDPALNELDILSVLTLGQTFGSIGADLGDRLRIFATQQLAGFGTRKLEQWTGLDRIDITGDILGRNGEQGARVSVTKRLSSRLIVTGETHLDRNLSERKMRAHYRLTPRIALEGETSSEGDNGVDIIFRYSR